MNLNLELTDVLMAFTFEVVPTFELEVCLTG